MKRCLPCVGSVAIGLLLFTSTTAHADIIYESATLGDTGMEYGWTLSTEQFIGSRFTVDEAVLVTAVGGHLVMFTGDGLFGAIVRMSGEFPAGSPFTAEEVMATTTFDPGRPSCDYRAPLSVVLPPGDYALVFGAGVFGSVDGGGAMPGNDHDTPAGEGSYILWSGPSSVWHDAGGSHCCMRFVVEGIPAVTDCDLDGDGVVAVGDLLILLADWGWCDEPDCPADFDLDGQVGVSDLLLLLAAWG